MPAQAGNTSKPEKRLQRRLRSQEVYDRLRRDIIAQRLVPGSALHEAVLSERYEASRTPVREAMLRLQQEGFLNRVGRQLRVKEFTFADVEELYQLREALEKMAVRLCIERAADSDLQEVETQLDSYTSFDPETDTELFNEHANQFHRSIARLSGNRAICNSLEGIHDRVLVISARWWDRAHSFEEAQREHGYILKAIWDRDVTLAEAAIRFHIQKVIGLYRQGNSTQGGESVERWN
jgi:GntR family transcriptional regulator, rspAB operon transcriptional repressor